jgi:hypothetical protein
MRLGVVSLSSLVVGDDRFLQQDAVFLLQDVDFTGSSLGSRRRTVVC